MKRILCVLLAMIVVATLAAPALAAENEPSVSPRYSYIQGMNAGLVINNWGLTDCTAGCTVYGGSSIILTCSLQQYNGSYWTTVKSWTSTTKPSAAIAKNYAVYSGNVYRVKASCSVYDASGKLLENGTCYSHQVTY